jgi:hypothetical protein
LIQPEVLLVEVFVDRVDDGIEVLQHVVTVQRVVLPEPLDELARLEFHLRPDIDLIRKVYAENFRFLIFYFVDVDFSYREAFGIMQGQSFEKSHAGN